MVRVRVVTTLTCKHILKPGSLISFCGMIDSQSLTIKNYSVEDIPENYPDLRKTPFCAMCAWIYLQNQLASPALPDQEPT